MTGLSSGDRCSSSWGGLDSVRNNSAILSRPPRQSAARSSLLICFLITVANWPASARAIRVFGPLLPCGLPSRPFPRICARKMSQTKRADTHGIGRNPATFGISSRSFPKYSFTGWNRQKSRFLVDGEKRIEYERRDILFSVKISGSAKLALLAAKSSAYARDSDKNCKKGSFGNGRDEIDKARIPS